MGLIKAIGGAIGGVFADQWKEYFYCDALGAHMMPYWWILNTASSISLGEQT